MNTEQRNHWNRQHKMLSRIITKPEAHTEAVAIILELHTSLYASEEGNGNRQPMRMPYGTSCWSPPRAATRCRHPAAVIL